MKTTIRDFADIAAVVTEAKSVAQVKKGLNQIFDFEFRGIANLRKIKPVVAVGEIPAFASIKLAAADAFMLAGGYDLSDKHNVRGTQLVYFRKNLDSVVSFVNHKVDGVDYYSYILND